MKRLNSSGFTLIEMLVALAAMSLLAGGAVMLVSFSSNAQERIEARDDAAVELLRLRSLLRSDLSQLAPHRARDESGYKPQVALLGPGQLADGAFLGFTRRGWDNLSGEDRPSLQYVEYRQVNDRIERAYRRRVDGSPLEPPQILADGVQGVSISYYQNDQWTEGWAGNPRVPFPRAVRLTIEFRDRGRLPMVFLLPEFAP
ncbi:MAG: type II secretion system minor pseudopilin GspJ [Hyphomonadaceae bacterium]